MLARNAKYEDFYEDTEVSESYGGIWSTNANENIAPNKITTYNLSTTGTTTQLTEDQRRLYSYERYNEDPGLKTIYNYIGGRPNINKIFFTKNKPMVLNIGLF